MERGRDREREGRGEWGDGERFLPTQVRALNPRTILREERRGLLGTIEATHRLAEQCLALRFMGREMGRGGKFLEIGGGGP